MRGSLRQIENYEIAGLIRTPTPGSIGRPRLIRGIRIRSSPNWKIKVCDKSQDFNENFNILIFYIPPKGDGREVVPSMKNLRFGGFVRTRLVFGVSALCGGFVLSRG